VSISTRIILGVIMSWLRGKIIDLSIPQRKLGVIMIAMDVPHEGRSLQYSVFSLITRSLNRSSGVIFADQEWFHKIITIISWLMNFSGFTLLLSRFNFLNQFDVHGSVAHYSVLDLLWGILHPTASIRWHLGKMLWVINRRHIFKFIVLFNPWSHLIRRNLISKDASVIIL
jgi:hypothetical protein